MSRVRILVVEDMEDDAAILKRAFLNAGVSTPLDFVNNGEEAGDYLSGAPPFSNREKHPLPSLMLLDLKMPRMNGFEVLEWLRLQPGLRRLPVIVFAGSARQDDVARAYELGANSYLVKPVEFTELVRTAVRLERYWLKNNSFSDCEPGTVTRGPAVRRVLLRDGRTGRYFSGEGGWTKRSEEHTSELQSPV